MTHAAPGGGRGPGDEPGDRLLAVILDPAGCLDLGAAADLADQNNPVSFRVGVEQLDDVEMRSPVDRVSADADASCLADVLHRELIYSLVGEGARPGHDPD